MYTREIIHEVIGLLIGLEEQLLELADKHRIP